MKLLELDDVSKEAVLRLSQDELMLISNALNEILNGVRIRGFEARVGVSREFADGFHAAFRAAVFPDRVDLTE
ncbi:hypothetical protein [Myxococcus hansupus]|uniref:hypothetical protein n=1 Tax=Pseudomyxococcus hansupus TaxID=1297742 RepID=UPI0005D12BDF|nr:hypothetical protein [Myxococcus hansupus]